MRNLAPALLLACLLPAVALAQETAPEPSVVLRVEQGPVLVSEQGGEFISLEIDVSLRPEDRVLVPEGSVASLDYGDGCVVSLVTGAYPVAASCPLTPVQAPATAAGPAPAPGAPEAAAAAGGASTGMILGIVGGVAAIAAIAGGGGSSDSPPPQPPPPVSR